MHSNSKEATKLVNFVMVFLKLRLLALFIAALAMGKTQVQAENLLLGDENYTSKIHEMKGSARELMRSICPKNAANLETKLNDSFTCIEEIDDNENMMCDVLLQTKTCIKPLIDSMEHCVSPAEKGIYTYVMNTIYAIFKYVCHLDGEHFFALAWEKSKVQAKNLPSESAASRMLKRASIDIARRICPKDGTLLEDKLNQSFTCIERIDEDMILVCDVLIEADNCVKPVLEAIDRCGAPAEKEVYSHV
ncbi:hypothetical protein HUJ05_010883 [Dendroctonus ponderosae]|nr:hypothetical protein HUJ05_010883 [Dendroctonus ponderosae]